MDIEKALMVAKWGGLGRDAVGGLADVSFYI